MKKNAKLTLVGDLLNAKVGPVRRKPQLPVGPISVPAEAMQFELFTTFFGANKAHQSNSVEFWDAVPMACVHRNKQIELRNEYGGLGVFRRKFVFKGEEFQLAIHPALISEGGRDIAYYPAGDEELVKEVLLKHFSDQQYGLHDPSEDPPSSYVRFSLRLVQQELARHGHKRSMTEIRRSVEILSRSVLVISKQQGGKPLYSSPALADVLDVTRDDYLEDPGRFWVARLPLIISQALKSLEYRQYNYSKALQFKDPLTRWLHKRMTHRFTNASSMERYHIALSTIVKESGHFHDDDTRTSRRVARVERCLKEISAAKIVIGIETDIRRSAGQGKAIQEVVWNLAPHPEFVGEAKAANFRLKDAKERLRLVDSQGQIGR